MFDFSRNETCIYLCMEEVAAIALVERNLKTDLKFTSWTDLADVPRHCNRGPTWQRNRTRYVRRSNEPNPNRDIYICVPATRMAPRLPEGRGLGRRSDMSTWHSVASRRATPSPTHRAPAPAPAPRHGRVRLDRSRWPPSRHGRISSSSAWQGRSSRQRFVPAPPSPARAARQSHRGPRSRGASSSASAPPSSTRSPAWPPAAPRPALSLPERGRGRGFPQSSRFLGATFFRKYCYKAVLFFFCFRSWLMEKYYRFWRMWSGPTSSLSSLRTSAVSTSK